MKISQSEWEIFLNKHGDIESNFKSAAELAADAERRKSWMLAAQLWLKAQELAKKPDNRVWAERRSEICCVQGLILL
ncbi:hypothetical protein GRAQ_01725 [Rahnella aquatilis CIP 78.65 = ATCC 33071]|jgi:hypothetical protein|uniref:ANR family transcriptional regulator n=1 Tax=Rahnella aquatilis (strain ATCC 33071 / DSM 4594 / JCM 1683 / NBRC 105701 / NCIMB 13365 / CIP 78.65) TaxID=745277 RepID=H2IRM3_RAHAC|nr:ANR family transcriptional regulator [Rahnella aquatilis]AEX52524.1 hypothetical protein Rahaq2_2680 [Rahnella aquatilis CIP 78.65 = ATCC 33071]KFD06641.1 hypothetical protein GRAQ_01725 [Rahnella aquatilis CIP 78.65 = ATCC 33071]